MRFALFVLAILTAPLEAQKAAPAFSLRDLSNHEVRLADFKGKIVLLDLWATWCETCVIDIPVLNKLHEKYANRGVDVVGIAVQSGWADDIRPHVSRLGINYRVLVGTDSVMDRYQVIGVPTTVLIDQAGTIRKKYIGTPPGKEDEKAADLEREINKLLAGGKENR